MGEVPEEPNAWDKVDIVSKVVSAIGSIAIPIVLFVVGNQITQRQQQQSGEQLKADRVERMLGHLASQNVEEKMLAIQVCAFLSKQGQFPKEIVPALTQVAVADNREDVSASASAALQTAAQSADPSLAKLANSSLKSIPPRLNVHAPADDPKLTAAASDLAHQNVVVTRQSAPPDVPEKTELRYYRPEDAKGAQQMVDRLNRQGIAAQVRDFSQTARPNAAVRPKGYDLVVGRQQ